MGERVHIPVTIDIIVEGKFLMLVNKAASKYTHPDMVANSPLGNVAVGITAMIGEATYSSTLRCVNVL
jgi:hypothetical protein